MERPSLHPQIVQLNTEDEGPEFFELSEFDHPYPATKVMWHPQNNLKRDLLATTGDYLRLWSIREKQVVKLEGVFSNVCRVGTTRFVVGLGLRDVLAEQEQRILLSYHIF